MPTLTQLEYILAIDKHRHFGKAADSCHVSQPTLSMQVQKLEEELDLVIFDRSKKPIVATETGKMVLAQAKITITEFNKIKILTQQKQNQLAGRMRLAVIPTLSSYVLPHFLNDFSKQFPQIQLEVEEMETHSILSQLESDSIDVGLLATPLKATGIEEIVLFYESFSLLVNRHHEMANKKVVSVADLDGKDLWLLHAGHCFRNQIANLCSLRGKPSVLQNVRFESGSLETIKELVALNGGYTLLPNLATRFHIPRQTVIVPFKAPVPAREISLAISRAQLKRPMVDALATSIKQNVPDQSVQAATKGLDIIDID